MRRVAMFIVDDERDGGELESGGGGLREREGESGQAAPDRKCAQRADHRGTKQ